MKELLALLLYVVMPATNVLSIVYLMRRARELARQQRETKEEIRAHAFADVRVITVYFTEGPIQQEFFCIPARAEKRFDQLNPMDYAGDGRRITCVGISAPFKQSQ